MLCTYMCIYTSRQTHTHIHICVSTDDLSLMNNKKRLEPNRHLDRRDGSAFKNSLKLTYFTIAQQQKDPRSEQPQFERPGLHLLRIQKQPQDYESSGHFNIVPMTSVRLDTPRNNHRITKSDLGWGIWGGSHSLALWDLNSFPC